MPGTEISASKDVKKVSEITLAEGWAWSKEDADKQVRIGKTVTATAEYIGTDAQT